VKISELRCKHRGWSRYSFSTEESLRLSLFLSIFFSSFSFIRGYVSPSLFHGELWFSTVPVERGEPRARARARSAIHHNRGSRGRSNVFELSIPWLRIKPITITGTLRLHVSDVINCVDVFIVICAYSCGPRLFLCRWRSPGNLP
jgi:hypothetical protein